jgi:hypothetical protein
MIHAQHIEHLKCLVIKESASIGHGQVRTRDERKQELFDPAGLQKHNNQ